jgi:uracil-DNA glycosylase family 4
VERPLADEARAVIASARQLLGDLLEEGVHSFDRAAAPAQRSPAASSASAPTAPRLRTPEPVRPPEPPRSPAAAADVALATPEAIAWSARPSLDEVREALGECSRCGLAKGRNQIVFGDGNPAADLMFIGEGPGQEEDRRGLPFVGKAGELLTQMIEKGLGIARSEVYICNIVKCRPPNNRTPLENEVATCSPFLDGQIAAVRPKVIVALGKPAASLLLGREVAITRMRGTWHEYRGIPLMPTLHPAYILRQYTPENRRHVWEDLKAALDKSRG